MFGRNKKNHKRHFFHRSTCILYNSSYQPSYEKLDIWNQREKNLVVEFWSRKLKPLTICKNVNELFLGLK